MNHPHLMTDQDLVCLFQSGEEHAFAELLKRHKDRIYSTIYYLVRDKDLAEDLFQDTFIRIINSLKKKHYNEEGKFLGWAIMVARHIVIDHFRANKMRMVREAEEYSPFDFMPESGRNAAEEMIHNEKTALVKRLIDRLPEHQREVVVLRHYSGLSFKEIADTLNINLNTALGRMHYAVIEMKRMMTGATEVETVSLKRKGRKPNKNIQSRKQKDSVKKGIKRKN
jgi:RNA polymerase sigma-70 factor (ECF subfamily)